MTQNNFETVDFMVTALSKFLQTFCSDIDYDCFVLVSGHLCVSIDTGKALEYVVNEKMCKGNENTTPIFLSNSFKKDSVCPDFLPSPKPFLLETKSESKDAFSESQDKCESKEDIHSFTTSDSHVVDGPTFHDTLAKFTSSFETPSLSIKQEAFSFSPLDECVTIDESNIYEQIESSINTASKSDCDWKIEGQSKALPTKKKRQQKKRQLVGVESDFVQKTTKTGKIRKVTGYKCNKCSKMIVGKKAYELHVMRHTGEKPYPCHICSKSFATQLQRDNHVWIHSDEKRFKCQICGHGVNSKVSLQYHMDKKHPSTVNTAGNNTTTICSSSLSLQNDTLIKQEISSAQFDGEETIASMPNMIFKDSQVSSITKQEMDSTSQPETLNGDVKLPSFHNMAAATMVVKKVTKSGVVKNRTCYKCSKCTKIVEGKKQFEVHMLRHSADKPFPCHICGKMFASPQFAKVHARLHFQGKRFKCEICGHAVNTKAHLKYHMTAKHSQDSLGTPASSFICDQCGKAYPSTSSLRYHKLTHLDDKSFVCSVCDKAFLTKRLLERHIVSHTGEKKYTCETCGRAFGHKHYLTKHRYTHTGERPYVCKICGLGFASNGTRTTHKRRHTGERPFSCECGKKFTQKGALGVHQKKCKLTRFDEPHMSHFL